MNIISDNQQHIRKQLVKVYRAALEAVHGRHLVSAHLNKMMVEQPNDNGVYVISIGKAAPEMLEGALDVLGEQIVSGLLITKHGYLCRPLPDYIKCIESGHPVPDESSLEAGRMLLDFIDALPAHSTVVFLISGGTSALVEDLPAGINLQSLVRSNDWLLKSGLDIHSMNVVRKKLSLIKAGRLACALEGHDVHQLLISDVPDDDLSVIGSGMLVASYDALGCDASMPADLPDWLQQLCVHAVPARNHPCFSGIKTIVLANSAVARQAAADCAAARGFKVRIWSEVLVSDVRQAALQVLASLRAEPDVVHIWSAEVSVRLPASPGQGGRCQALALEALMQFERDEQVVLLAAATDGGDGPGQNAGALVDYSTRHRGDQAGLDGMHCLAVADSGRYLSGLGALLNTGPTGSNVMDLIIAWHG